VSSRRGVFGGEFGSRTPVESRERRDAGVINDVIVPILLALAISTGVALVWLAFMLAIRAVEDYVFWLVATVAIPAMMLAPILTRWRHRSEMIVGDLGAGIILTLLTGWLAVAVYKLTRDLSVGEILSIAPVIGLPVGLVWLILSTFQESFFRSPFVEQAIGLLISGEKAPWYAGMFDREPPEVEPDVVRVEIADTSADGGGARLRNLRLPLSSDKARWLGQHITNGGAFSLPQCVDDGPLSRSEVESVRRWLLENSLGRWIDEDEHAKGFEIKRPGKLVFRELAKL